MRSEEHGLLCMVPIRRRAWFLGMIRQKNYFNTKPTDSMITSDARGANCRAFCIGGKIWTVGGGVAPHLSPGGSFR